MTFRAIVVVSLAAGSAAVPPAHADPPPQGRYLVTLAHGAALPRGGQIFAALHGYAATMTPAAAAALATDPAVPGSSGTPRCTRTAPAPPPSWGLDRIDQAALPLDGAYTWPDVSNAVTAYVVDTGIRTMHVDFGGRAVRGTNADRRRAADGACDYSPGRVAEAVDVSSTDEADSAASSSNRGPCVDLYAPGRNITSDWNTPDTVTTTLSGSSRAAAHVAGGLALLLGADPSLTRVAAAAALSAGATPGVVIGAGPSVPNLLLHVG